MKGSPRRILVVDDDRGICEVLCHQLEDLGYEPKAVHDAVEALLELSESTPRLVLLDAMLLGIDGFELCRQLKRTRPELPVVMMSAVYRRGAMEGEVCADAFLEKPFALEKLQPLLETLIRK